MRVIGDIRWGGGRKGVSALHLFDQSISRCSMFMSAFVLFLFGFVGNRK
jgi:hypothetical protein